MQVFNLQQHLFNSKSTIQIQKLKSELLATRKELLQTSAQDEFAKWAKLKRKFDKLTVEYDECAKSIAGKKEVTVTFVSWGLPGLLWAFQILLLVIWRAEPVFYIPEQWFGPITNWLKFPFAPEDQLETFSQYMSNPDTLNLRHAALNIKKPLNAFFRYKAAMREKIIQRAGTHKNSDLSRLAAQMWKEEPQHVKDHFNRLTQQAFNEHRQKFPGYVWPSRSSKFKKAILKLKFESQTPSPEDQNAVPFDFKDFKTGFTPEIEECPPILEYIDYSLSS
ncbi:GET complex subunit get1 [Boothiomyces macroporosus]|uniref:GET complex subunit get1 n=1 Tax=Boothiomyces macroporosus TaxID=261099 RepID=A0AAD5UFS4_9FUNG|nr:GET complex subunit get1 [Boothiomyces macroporosus]